VNLLSARRSWAALLAAVAVTACGRAEATDPQALQRLESLQEDAQSAVDEVASLHVRVVRLERRLLRAQSAHRRLRRGAATDLRRLTRSVDALRKSSKELAEVSAAAGERAEEAARAASSAARDLTVLTRRFDYHLRHHGK
jgi:predicted  nucleic acid-binding Zn-ribbon protein